MASNIIPFESAKLPAHLKGVDIAALNADLTGHASTGFPVISIRGKTFAVVKGGERTILPNPKDPDSPATSIDVVIVKANPKTSKIYYAAKYEEGSDSKPDCYSTDGVRPATDATSPQSKTCATCKHNQWGARVTESGKKGKACSDNVRIAVTTPGQLNEPYLLRVPPASIRALGDYGNLLKNRGVAYNMVVTRIGFEPEAATPQLTFKPVGFLDEDAYNTVQETAAGETVTQILGGLIMAHVEEMSKAAVAKAAGPSKDAKVTVDEVKTAVDAAAQPRTSADTNAQPSIDSNVEVDLDNLEFD